MTLNNNLKKKDCNEKRDKPACRQAGLLIKTNRDGWPGVVAQIILYYICIVKI